MAVIEKLFSFPVIMFDEDSEKKRRMLDLPGEEDGRYATCIAEYPYYHFEGICERWLPTKESFEKALDGEFEACMVTFLNVGTLLVPWSRRRFKSELKKFIDSLGDLAEQQRIPIFFAETDTIKKITDKEEKTDNNE